MEIFSCYICRDQGLKGGCPKCGKHIVPRVIPTAEMDELAIPKNYRDNLIWDSGKLYGAWPAKRGDRQFERYVKILDSLIEAAKNGAYPEKSMMLIAEPGTGKHSFIYALMNLYREQGRIVAPIIDHNEYRRLLLSCTDKFYLEQSERLDLLIQADFAVMTVEPLNRYKAIESIASLMRKRANEGKATYVLSDYPLSNLTNDFNKMIDIRYRDGLDDLRYARIITM